MKNLSTVICVFLFTSVGFAQDVKLHVNPRWEECSFQLDPALSQKAWHDFTKEAGLVAYFRPLVDAKPMKPKKFEVSLLQWRTAIDETKPKWNDTFVHPDSTHWLVGGPSLPIPGLMIRVGITNKIDVGLFWTKSFGANYSIAGAQIQYNVINNEQHKWALATRLNFSSIYGPEDLNLYSYGVDGLASKEFRLFADWASISPYAGVSFNAVTSHEKSEAVHLRNENVINSQAFVGAVARLSIARVGIEYNASRVSTISFKIGLMF